MGELWLLAWNHFSWTHQVWGRLEMMTTREALLRGPYVLAGVCRRFTQWRHEWERKSKEASTWVREESMDRKKNGQMNQRTLLPFEAGKCMFSLKVRRGKINPGLLILKPFVFSTGWPSDIGELYSLVKNLRKLHTVFKAPFMLVGSYVAGSSVPRIV